MPWLARIFVANRFDTEAVLARNQAELTALTITSCVIDGELPALLMESSASRIIPMVEGLVFPWVLGMDEMVANNGPFGALIQALRTHTAKVLKKGVCLYPDGGWKLSSTADYCWLSKAYLCQFVVREILGLRTPTTAATADRAHVKWLLADENIRWAWSDQMKSGIAKGSLYYPRGVTAILWLEESQAAD